MNTTNKVLIGVAGTTVASAMATAFTVRGVWGAITKHRVVGLSLLAIVSYHTFDNYRASVDNAWSKVETVVERRAEAEAAEARAATEQAEAKANAAQVDALLNKTNQILDQEKKEQKAKAKALMDETVSLAEHAKATGKPHDIKLAMAAWDDMMDYVKPLAEADGKSRQYEVQRAASRAELLALITPKPKPKAKPAVPKINPDEVVWDKPAPVEVAVKPIDKVAEARSEFEKAKATCAELAKIGAYCFSEAGTTVAGRNLTAARNKLAAAITEAN